MRRVISNTSCLIALSNIHRLDILKLAYGSVCITPEVAQEFGEILPDWIEVVAVRDASKTQLIHNSLDLGESSTIALAMEEDALMILDDGKARRFADSLQMNFTGTLGVIVKVKRMGAEVDLQAIIHDFRKQGFRIPNDIEDILLNE